MEDMFDFPQVRAESMLTDFEHPVVGCYRGFTRACAFGRTRGPKPFAAPTLDQHGQALRGGADAAVEALRSDAQFKTFR